MTDVDRKGSPRELRADGDLNRPGAAGTAAATNGTYHRSAAEQAAQGDAFRANNGNYYRNYGNVDAYAGYANAWRPNAVVAGSFYTHPGYGALATGLGMAAVATPYNYGTNVVTQPSTVYVNGDAAASPQDYASQATQIAATGQTAQPADDTKWLPLGVFAMVEGDATNSDDVFQLAVDKEGIIRGNYHNVKTDDVETVTGSVDKQSQRAAWTIGSDKFPVYEAGISNLTKSQTPVLVHTEDGGANQVSLIRLEEPPQQ